MNISFHQIWRKEPLTSAEEELLSALLAAHDQLARRNNLSTDTAIGAAQGSGDFCKAFTAALLTIGGKHAPLSETMAFLRCNPINKAHEIMLIEKVLGEGAIPGWGNSIVKGEPDPIWDETWAALGAIRPDLLGRIDGVTDFLQKNGKRIFPNAACYTAATALALGIPPKTAPFLFIAGRMAAWSELIHQNL